MFDPMSELSGGDDSHSEPAPEASHGGGHRGGRDGGRFADEVHSITIHAKQRTFYIDLKESSNGKFFKVSEKSRGGRKTTIMFDAEDLQQFVDAFTEMKSKV